MSSRLRNRLALRLGAGALALGWLVSCQVDKLFQDGGPSDPPPARLEFAPPPNATAGEPLSPAVRVSAVDSTGTVDTTFHGAVTVTLGEHPTGAVLRGTRAVDAVRGVASFADLSINRAGTGYTLVATATGVRGATSSAFDVAPAAAARLAFTAQPHAATVDSVLKPPVQVAAFDTLGNVATSFAANVTVALAANASGGTLAGTTTVPAASGVATFADLSVNRAGTGYRLTAAAGQLTGATSDAFDITAGPPTTGDLTVNATTTGDNAPGSYTVTVDGGLPRTIAANGAGTTYNGLSGGDHVVALTDVPANCTVSGGPSKTVTVPAGGAATAAFTISCTALSGSLTVTTATTGANAPNSYTVTVDGGSSRTIQANNGSTTYTGLSATDHTVALTNVPTNCTVTGGASQTVTVPAGGTGTAAFTVTCSALIGDLTVSTSTSGSNPPSGYSVTVDGGQGQSIAANGNVGFPGLPAGNHSVQLNGVPANCSVSGLNPRTVTVPAGGTVEASFTISCSAVTGTLNVTTSTSGDSPDPSGYTFTVDNGTPQAIQNSQTIPLTLPTGSHTVRLGDVAANCTVTNGTSRTVTVPAGGAVSASFAITCQAVTGSLTVSTSTSGPSAPSSYTVTLDGGQSESILATGTANYNPVSLGSHSVALNGVPNNCSVAEANPQTVTVSAGGTAQSTFTITCVAPPPPNQPPTAAFTSSCNQLTCGFSDGSSDPDGSVQSWHWDFGDGQTGSQRNPSHTYSAGGTYTVTLTVTDNDNASSSPVSHQVNVTAPPPPNQPPSAAFTSSCNQLTCSFTDQSSDPDGSVQSWHWDFGDGQTGSQRNPSHAYSAGGAYTVTLTVTDNQNASSSPVSHQVNVTAPPPPNQPPTAGFTSSCNQLTCSFTDQSSDPDGSVQSWHWDFGDGQTGSQRNPSHTYSAGGTYTVTLTVTDNQNASSSPVSHQVSVTAPPPPNQPPSAAFTSSCNQLTCSFTDGSSDPDGSVQSWHWDFGDGQTGSQRNPSHTYSAGGTYTVTLTVTDNQNASSSPVSHQVSVTAPPPPNQPPSAAFTSSCNQLTCSFTDGSSDPDGSVQSWHWDFGDGQTGSQRNPSHAYSAGGTYTVTLTVTDNQNASSSPVSHQVNVTAPPPPNQPPTADFSASCNDLQCSFTDRSSDPDGRVVSWSWRFGDGSVSNSQSPSHTYGAAGTYTVQLTVTDDQGAPGTTSQQLTVTAPPPPNHPPVVNAGGDQTVLLSVLSMTLDGASFSDVDHDGPWTVTIDWGDGNSTTYTTSNEGSISRSHSYPLTLLGHDYTLTVTVVDSHGARSSASKTVHVVVA